MRAAHIERVAFGHKAAAMAADHLIGLQHLAFMFFASPGDDKAA